MKKFAYTSMVGAAALGLFSQFVSVRSFAADATGTARAVVIQALAIANTTDLDFGSGAPGDAAKIVAPGTAETSENGSFAVTGQPNSAYTITLPSTAVTLTTGSGTATEQIAVDTFTSFPAAGANGLLGANGYQDLFVGATRAALLPNQAPGEYVGTYTVTVVY